MIALCFLKDAEEFERSVFPPEDEQRLTVEVCVLLYLRNHGLCPNRRKLYTWMDVGGPKKPGCVKAIAAKFADELTRRGLEIVRDAARASGCSAKSVNIYALGRRHGASSEREADAINGSGAR